MHARSTHVSMYAHASMGDIRTWTLFCRTIATVDLEVLSTEATINSL